MLHAVTANFLGDNLQCWMQIQVGKGPWASEVSGIVKIGQTMTMVLAIKDDENKFDMLVRNCVAHDGKRAPIQLVCRYNCPEPKCGGLGADYGVPLLGGNALSAGEYGLPNAGHGEYGPPPPVPHSEYGVPPAFPDPRHPADVAGAYSEKRDDTVPPPQAQVSSTPNAPSPSSPAPSRDDDDVNLPPPPPPGRRGVYNTVKRKDEGHGNLATLGGRPRSVEDLPESLVGIRRRRETSVSSTNRIYKRDAQEMTDVNTSRTIQVVAPGDVNFALNNAATNETVVIQSPASDPETICMSVPSFVAGLVMLLLVLVVASLVAAFLFVRVRALDRKGAHGAAAYYETDYVKHTN
ncbi:Dusky isoform A [Danaus plexippus plexippus]|uniref:Dusky isoform A n=1 Tax=Danaus plexippus plexippus TaxID=278856 RepID=A0A212F1V7_DANPL|nr:Dusky isoform A [Danaus plexippus plexippus]